MNPSPLTRRSLLALGASVPVLLGPVAAAQAKRRPRLGSAPSLTLGTKAQVVPASGSEPSGLRFSVMISEGGQAVAWNITHLYVDGVRIPDIEPSLFIVESTHTYPMVARPITATGTVSVVLGYARGNLPEVFLPTTKVTVVPIQARPPKGLR